MLVSLFLIKKNKYKKQSYYMENKFLFLNVTKNGHIFSQNVSHFQYDYRFLFSKEMGNIRACKEVRLQKLTKFRLSG